MIVLINYVFTAILKHPNYDATLTIEELLGAEWYPQNDL